MSKDLDDRLAQIDKSIQLRLDGAVKTFLNQAETREHQSPYSKTEYRIAKTPLAGGLGCNCRPFKRNTRPAFCENDEPHHGKNCVFHFLNKRSKALAGEVRVLSTLFRWKVGFQWLQSGLLKSLEIRPALVARSIVHSESSPALQSTDRLKDLHELTESQIENRLFGILVSLQQLFAEGKAWPTDITTNGRTILHVS